MHGECHVRKTERYGVKGARLLARRHFRRGRACTQRSSRQEVEERVNDIQEQLVRREPSEEFDIVSVIGPLLMIADQVAAEKDTIT